MTEYPTHAAAPEADDNRKKLLLAGGLAALLVVGGGGYYLMSSGSDTVPVSAPVPRPVVKPAPAKKAAVKPATATKAAAKKTTVLAPATAAIGRNPFAVLYSTPVVAAPGAATVSPVTATSTSTSTSASSPASGSTTSVSPTTGTQSPSTAAYALKLISVDNPAAGYAHHYVFSVDGVKESVVTNQRFGKNGELVVLNYLVTNNKASGATVQVGDDNPVQVSTGQTRMVI